MNRFEYFSRLAKNTTLVQFLELPIEQHKEYCHARLCWSQSSDWKDPQLFDHLTHLTLVYGTLPALKSLNHFL